MTLIAPLVARYTVNGTYAGRDVANIWDVAIDLADGPDRDAAVADMAGRVVSGWADEMLDRCVNNYQCQSVSWVDMNAADGTTGTATTGPGGDFPASGASTDPAMPGNIAIRGNKNVTARRGSKSGRLYLVGVPESITTDANPNNLDPTYTTSYNTTFANFLAATTTISGIGGASYTSVPVVVHTRTVIDPITGDKDVEYVSQSLIRSFTVDPTLGSQRRRLR